MVGKFTDENELYALLKKFEDATISRGEWKHAEHLAVALIYVRRHGLETATEKMRSGILDLLTKGYGVDLKVDMPYHETLTIFWMRTVAEFSKANNGASLLGVANDLVAQYDKGYPLMFYSRERLFSDEARSTFIEVDISDL